MTHQYIQHGSPAKVSEVRSLIEHNIRLNKIAEVKGRRKTPLCIWGPAGIGKTELVEAFAKQNNYQLAYVAPAQFEEMGDLLGMPQLCEGRMLFAPPDWAPRQAGPGILLIDDVNRAEERILRGLMQLFQNHRLISWQLPPDWHILLTANPDTGDYSVTPMDEAMLGRLRHVSMQFNLPEWFAWAESQQLDERGLEFIQCYPEVMGSAKVSPRRMTQFLESIQPLEDLKAELSLVKLLAEASLDSETSAAFLHFVSQEMGQLPSPADVLKSENLDARVVLPLQKWVQGELVRMDMLSLFGERLVAHIRQLGEPLTKEQKTNLVTFLQIPWLPNDWRLVVVQQLMKIEKQDLQLLAADPALGRLLIS